MKICTKIRFFRLSSQSFTILKRKIINGSSNKHSIEQTDIAIFGGGIMGSSIAYFLKDKAPINLNVTVFERDPCYTRASTTLSVGGIRQQFSLTENIQMSMYTAQFLNNIKKHLSILDKEPPDVAFHQNGYLTLADDSQVKQLLANYKILYDHGASVELLTAHQIKKQFPMINCKGIKAGVYGTHNEGWFDPYQLLIAMKNKAMFLGAKFVHATVFDFHVDDTSKCHKVAVRNPNDTVKNIEFDIGIVCTGYDSNQLARFLRYGSNEVQDFRRYINFPIEPRKRYVFVFNCKDIKPDWNFPFLIDKSGVYCRREGLGGNFICGRSPPTSLEEPEIDNLDIDYSYFDQHIHPILADRVPQFEAIKIKAAWAGFYDYNTLDQNPIIGPDPFYSNIFWATGFSGHGIQMAPALGRAMMEYIIHGRYETIDLQRFGWTRILENRPLKEQNIY